MPLATLPLGNYIALYAILFACAAICAAKGRFRLLVVGLFFPFFWIVGAVRPAKPDSIFARIRTTYFAGDPRTPEDTWH